MKRAYVLDKLNLEDVHPNKFNSICDYLRLSHYDYLKNINFTVFDINQVSILIGTDNIDLGTSQALIKRTRKSTTCNFYNSWLDICWSNSRYTREFSFPSLLFSPQPHQRKRSHFQTTSINLENGNLRNLSGGNPLQRQETRP